MSPPKVSPIQGVPLTFELKDGVWVGTPDEGEELSEEQKRTWYSEYNIYRATMFFSLIASVAIIGGLPRPVYLVLVASALAYFVAPVIFFLNLYYCLTIIKKDDKVFYPSTFASWFGWLSLIVFTGMSIILIMQRLFGITLF